MAEPASNSAPRCRRTTAPIRTRYRSALEAHFHAHGGWPRRRPGARPPGARTGISILDVVNIHMEARRDLFPTSAPGSPTSMPSCASRCRVRGPPDELRDAQRLADAEAGASTSLRRLRDVAADLSRATTRRAVAAVMLRATLEVAGGRSARWPCSAAVAAGSGVARPVGHDAASRCPPAAGAERRRRLHRRSARAARLARTVVARRGPSSDRGRAERPCSAPTALSAYPIVWRSRGARRADRRGARRRSRVRARSIGSSSTPSW